jgi:hypothetical protein
MVLRDIGQPPESAPIIALFAEGVKYIIPRFSHDGDALSLNWRARVVSEDAWQTTSSPGADGGEAGGYRVTSGTSNAYAKPSKADPATPRAAHEKIAADLAHDIGVPLPGALLYRWPTLPSGCGEQLVALSLIPFLTAHKWATIKAAPPFEAQLKQELREAASVLVVFDTWLGNTDRANDGNLLVSKAAADGSPTQFAYIDYSFSMSYPWQQHGFDKITACPMFPTDTKDADIAAMDAAISRVVTLAPDTVREIVTRIPNDFLPDATKILIIDGLLHRRTRLRPALRAVYGGIP